MDLLAKKAFHSIEHFGLFYVISLKIQFIILIKLNLESTNKLNGCHVQKPDVGFLSTLDQK